MSKISYRIILILLVITSLQNKDFFLLPIYKIIQLMKHISSMIYNLPDDEKTVLILKHFSKTF